LQNTNHFEGELSPRWGNENPKIEKLEVDLYSKKEVNRFGKYEGKNCFLRGLFGSKSRCFYPKNASFCSLKIGLNHLFFFEIFLDNFQFRKNNLNEKHIGCGSKKGQTKLQLQATIHIFLAHFEISTLHY
jgi:hypothetical protein